MSFPRSAVRPLGSGLCVLVALAGCAPAPRSAPDPVPVVPPIVRPIPPPKSASPVVSLPAGAVIPLEDLLQRARHRASTQDAIAALRQAAQAAVTNAQTWANPELELRTGNSRYRTGESPDQRTYGVEVRQRFELPGKRDRRLAAAQAGLPVAELTADELRLDLEVEVRSAAVALGASQIALHRAKMSADLAAALRQTVELRTTAGELAKADLARARLEETTAGITVVARQREVDAALQVVRSWAGDDLPSTFTIADALPGEPPAISLDTILHQARESHPRLRRLDTEIAQKSAAIHREQRAWLPDVTLGVSADRTADTEDLGVSLGVDVPLWNQGSGALATAEAERAQASVALRQECQRLERDLRAAWNAYESARLELTALVTQAQPVADEAVRLRQTAYAAGENSLADLLEARRAAQTVAEATDTARRTAAEAGIALGRAIGSFPTLLPHSQRNQP